MLTCTSYADASGKNSGPLLCVCGVISRMRQWKRFEHQWRKALAKEDIKVFHATDFASSKREFETWRGATERRGKFFANLLRIIRNNLITAPLSATIERADWDAANGDFLLEETFYSPYAICGYALVGEAMRWASQKDSQPRIKFIFEDGDDGQDGLKKLCKKDGITPIFQSKSEAVPCQAADLIAWKSRTACKNAAGLNAQLSDAVDFQSGLKIFEKLIDEYESVMPAMVSDVEPKVFSQKNLVAICEREGVPRRRKIAP